MITDIWSIEDFLGSLDLDLVHQGHHKHGKSSLNIISHTYLSLTVTEIWPSEKFEGQFDLDLITQGQHKCGK